MGRLVIVSNRLPITIESRKNDKRLHPSSGGLVSALGPILKDSGGCWIGWAGTDPDETVLDLIAHWGSKQGYSLAPVFLTAFEQARYYREFSNGIVWPLFHGVLSPRQFDSGAWQSYCEVNAKFAAAVEGVAAPGDVIWVHDYHLMMCGDALRRRDFQLLAYFHHIPFPAPDIFEVLPWRVEVLRGLLEFIGPFRATN
jgi:trehalose-6-phosphate synthase